MHSSDHLLVTEAAKLLGISPQTLRNWSKSGHIASKRHPLNGYRVFLKRDVLKLSSSILALKKPTLEAQKIDWDFPRSSPVDSIHAFHPYPAKFIPDIPRALLELFPPLPGTCVFDPFCGSGTTLVEAQLKGYDSVGVDLNPIACLLSRIKTTPIPKAFESEYLRILNEVRNLKDDACYKLEIPNVSHWFEDEVAQELDKLRRAISTAPAASKIFLEAAMSSIIVRVSNQESDTRYAAIKKNVTAETVRILFTRTCERIISLWAGRGHFEATSRIIQKDVRALESNDFESPIGLTITSPPYPNAYEYWLYHKYRMYWLRHDPIAVKANEIGARAHYFKKEIPSDEDFFKILKDLLSFCYTRSARGAYACVVIGRSVIHGRVVDNAALTEKAAAESGFEFITKMGRTMRKNRKSFNLSHARIAKEDVLIFKKP